MSNQLCSSSSRQQHRRGGWVKVVALVAIALAAVAILLSVRGTLPHITATTVAPLAGLLLLLMAGLFPLSAIAFARLEAPLLVRQLKRDCKLLGTPEGSEDYGSDSIARRWSHGSYAIHYSLAISATVLGIGLFFLDLREHDRLLDINTLKAMRYGFLGAYIYCLGLIYRRYTTLDLQPHIYLNCAAGLIAGMAFNYVAFEAIANVTTPRKGAVQTQLPVEPSEAKRTEDIQTFDGIGGAASAILAFCLGYFPNLAISWFGRLSRSSLHERQRRSDDLPLSLIDGISVLHEARLQDEGIDNIQNLATANIRDLVAKTPFSAQEIVEWIDQAVLYLYLDSSQIESFRRAGVRSVSDFSDLWRGLYVNYVLQSDGTIQRRPKGAVDNDFANRRKAIAQQLQSMEERLDGLYLATEEGPNMDLVRTYWQNVQELATRARTSLVRQVCCSVGNVLRESAREGSAVTPSDVLKQVAESLFRVFAGAGDELSAEVTAESIYGEAWLNRLSGRLVEARRLYEQCIEKFPDSPAAFNDLAWLYLDTLKQQSHYDQALKYATMATDLAKKSQPPARELPGYMDTLALACIRLQRPEEGIQWVDIAIAEWKKLNTWPQPKFMDTLVTAAEVLQAQGKKDAAIEVLRRVLKEGYADETTKERATKLRDQVEPLNTTAAAAKVTP